jgi:hypothetical protein
MTNQFPELSMHYEESCFVQDFIVKITSQLPKLPRNYEKSNFVPEFTEK